MTLLSLAVKNVRHRALSYSAYFLSGSFAVWLFFLYTSLLYHPELQEKTVGYGVRATMEMMQWVVSGFAVFFMLYAHSAFVRVRQPEFGLFTLLGMKPGQVSRMVWVENSIIGAAAVGTGVGFGLVFGRLFYLVVGRVLYLETPLAFHVSGRAMLLTGIVFAAIYALISIATQLRLAGAPVATLLKGLARPQAAPRWSPYWAGLGALCLVLSYGMAFTIHLDEMQGAVAPILLGLLVGTYLLIAQGSVGLLRRIQRARPFCWRGINLLTVSQLLYKVAGNARILFMVSILSAMALVAVGVYAGSVRNMAEYAPASAPRHLMVAGAVPGVEETLVSHQVAVHARVELLAVGNTVLYRSAPAHLYRMEGSAVSVSAVNRWLTALAQEAPLTVPEGQAVILYGGNRTPVPPGADVQLADDSLPPETPPGRETPLATVTVAETRATKAFNQHPLVNELLVLDDAAFSRLWAEHGKNYGTTVTGYSFARWEASGKALAALEHSHDRRTITGTALNLLRLKRDAAFMLFVSGFLALLFFLAAGNLLYCKLFTDLYQDRLQYQALHKVGVAVVEIRQVVSAQALVLFFAPLLVAAVHAFVAVGVLGHRLFKENLLPYMAVVAVGYALLQGAYYLVARRVFLRALLSTK